VNLGSILPDARTGRIIEDASTAALRQRKLISAALWVDIIGQRNNFPSRLPEAFAEIDMTAWPAPVVRMFLGRITPAEVLAAADDPDASKKKILVCDANFYGGELALRQGAKEQAARLFRLVAADCPYISTGRFAAGVELQILSTAP
jgi:lipoprotein NlpI